MDAVKVKRDELLAKLSENRSTHRATFERALEGYRKQVIDGLEQMLADARNGKRRAWGLALIEPMDQTRDYDRVITMLKMSQDDVIELSEHDFSQYVMDDWKWKGQFITSTASYTSG